MSVIPAKAGIQLGPGLRRDDEVLVARGIRKSYAGREVVAGLDLELKRGECYGLLGPNGAGKTTTLRMLLGLTDPDAGEITLLGRPVPKAAREGRIRVGVVPQVDNLDPDFTVRENLLVYGRREDKCARALTGNRTFTYYA